MCEFTLELSVDPEAYGEFQRQLAEFLKEVSTNKKRLSVEFEKFPTTDETRPDKYGLKKGQELKAFIVAINNRKVVALGHPVKKPAERIDYTFFELDEVLHKHFRDVPALNGEYQINFLDDAEDILYTEVVSAAKFASQASGWGSPAINTIVYGESALGVEPNGRFYSTFVLIGPTFTDGDFRDSVLHRPKLQAKSTVTIPLDILKSVNSIQVQPAFEDRFSSLLDGNPEDPREEKAVPKPPSAGGVF